MLRALAIVAALVASQAGAAVALDAGFPQRNTGTGATVAVTVTTPGADRLLVAIACFTASGNGANSVSGGGLTWTSQGKSVDGSGLSAVEIFTAPAASAITAQVITLSVGMAAARATDFAVFSFSGADLTDIGAVNGMASTSSANGTFSLTIEAANSLVYGGAAYWNGDTGWTGAAGHTVFYSNLTVNSDDHANFSKDTATSGAGALTTGVTISAGAGFLSARAIEIKESSGSPPPAAPPMRSLMGVGT